MTTFKLGRASLLACAISLAAFGLAGDRIVKIQPILTAKSDGTGLVDYVAYESYAQKIWEQAGIDLQFLPSHQLNDTSYYNFDDTVSNAALWSKVTAPGKGQSSDPLTINVFFTNKLLSNSSYGFGYLDNPYMVLDVTLIKSFSALGRVDTFSHELGHNLNLDHYDATNPSDATKANHLMASGGIRNIPQTLTDVAPDGAKRDLLGATEIAAVRRSKFAQVNAVPEPVSMVALGAGFLALCRRRRSA